MRKSIFLWLFGFSIFILFGCAHSTPLPTRAPSETPASPSAGAWTPTSTPVETSVPTVTLSRTLAPTPSETGPKTCLPVEGTWESKEAHLLGPILSFRIADCRVVSLTVMVYVADGELYPVLSETNLPIVENAFEYSEESGAGKLILGGRFDSEEVSRGTMTFTKGFDVFGTVLTEEVVIPWHAEPI